MLALAHAPALVGIDGRLVSIECDITNGLPGFVVVGLGDKAVDQSRERIRSAIKNSGLTLPARRITLNLAPADLPKDGTGYDLGMAAAILVASGQLEASTIDKSLFLGELALDGSLRPVRGGLIASHLAAVQSFKRLFVPTANAAEASLLNSETEVYAISSLQELFLYLKNQISLAAATPVRYIPGKLAPNVVNFNTIYGQKQARRAAEIAVAGGHNLLLSGPPGTGKTLIAKAMLGIMPPAGNEEQLQIAKLYSLVNNFNDLPAPERPFRAPHHTASPVSMVGGGTRPRPGEISLSHGGILFLDEILEFPRQVLETLRQPLEDGRITITRASGSITFPARFVLVATRNPCPCGYFGGPQADCTCSLSTIIQYQRKLSGPILDRFDLTVNLQAVDPISVLNAEAAEPSDIIAKRVTKARKIQNRRFGSSSTTINAYMTNDETRKYCKINSEIATYASVAMTKLGLSVRSYMRVLKVARTIADLEGSETIARHHFSEALSYRFSRFEHPIVTAGNSPSLKRQPTINSIV